ncbi:MAG: single-stranded DNA-binding protein [Candidatus Obscuribacterales bacterium]|nr:single-stranded DNA-binding protein [Candidatus Obscuribacterales bacterium]
MSMVTVSLVGNLVKAPEQVCFASGRTKTTLVVAVNYHKGGGVNSGTDCADFYRVETWGKLAELAQKYLDKGNQVGISGKLIMEHWTDKQGRERLTPVVSATQLSLPPRAPRLRSTDSFEPERTHTDEPEIDEIEDRQSELIAAATSTLGATVVKEPIPIYRSRRR